MPSGINLSFERLSPSKGQVGYVLLTRAPVAIGCIATTMLPLDLHVLSLQLAFILSQDQTLHCKSIFNDFKFLIRTISPFCSVQDDSNLSLPIIISIDGSSFTRNLTISCQASLLYYLYCLCNSIIDRLSIRLTDFLSESGCKGKNFIAYLPNIFESFFFQSSLFSFLPEGFPLSSLLRKVGRTRTGGSSKAHRVSFSMSTIVCLFSENGCKGKNFISYLPNVFRTFFSKSFVTV